MTAKLNQETNPTIKPLVLLILDGFGYRNQTENNAIAMAKTPQWQNWWQNQPHILLDASGECVGLPKGQMGNSEVGHMHIAAGRIIPQDFTRINESIRTNQFQHIPLFKTCFEQLKQNNKTLHILGLLSDGGVHSHQDHLFAFLKLCEQQNFKHVKLHLFLDGRDTPPQSALSFLKQLKSLMSITGVGEIVSLCGRYYAMDRDQRWERLLPFYQLLTEGIAEHHSNDAFSCIRENYEKGIYDEFIPATKLAHAPIVDGDSVFFFNFRADRARQLTNALIGKNFVGFPRKKQPKIAQFLSMTPYAKSLDTQAVFRAIDLKNTLGEIFSQHGFKQLRLAETEKYAHVTFFFNGGREQPFSGEERLLIESPKVPTYDLQPQMSAPEITQALINAIKEKKYPIIICNYANADMVGHTGNLNAAIQSIESLDHALAAIWQTLKEVDGQLLITADHGNAECMYDEAIHQPHTAHTTEPVPLMLVTNTQQWQFKKSHASLIDIAPTLLYLLGIKAPKEMTGQILLEPRR